MRNRFVLAILFSFSVCSAQAQTAPQKDSGAADGASESAAAQANVALRDAEPEYKPPNGYRKAKTKKNGEATYCKKEQVIGTRFAKTYCYTQLQLEQLERQNAEVRRDVTRSQTQQNPIGG
jgi:hypothetical protein